VGTKNVRVDAELKANAIGYKVNAAYVALRRRFQDCLRDSGVSVTPEQWVLLSCLIDLGDMRLSEIGRRVNRDQTTVTRLVDGVERLGFVARVADPEDRRAWRVVVTGEGRRTFERSLAGAKEYNESLSSLFTSEEKDIFLGFLDRVIG
jgi:DNA-binding MarR family transcriptional regulator